MTFEESSKWKANSKERLGSIKDKTTGREDFFRMRFQGKRIKIMTSSTNLQGIAMTSLILGMHIDRTVRTFI